MQAQQPPAQSVQIQPGTPAMQQPPPLPSEGSGIMKSPSFEDPMDAFSHLSVDPSPASNGVTPAPGSTDGSLASAPTSANKQAEQPKYKKGDAVCYTSNDKSCKASIVKVHLDDALEPFYTIQLESGKEKQTDDAHLSPLDPLYEKITGSLFSLSSVQLQKVDELIAQLIGSSSSSAQPNGFTDTKMPSPPDTGSSQSAGPNNLPALQVDVGRQQLPLMNQQLPAMEQMGQQPPLQMNSQQAAAGQSSAPLSQGVTPSAMPQMGQQQIPQMNPAQTSGIMGQQQQHMNQQQTMGLPHMNNQQPTMGAPQMNQQQHAMGQAPQPQGNQMPHQQMQQGGFGQFGQPQQQMSAPPTQQPPGGLPPPSMTQPAQMNQMQQPMMGQQQLPQSTMQPGMGQQQPHMQSLQQPMMGQQQPQMHQPQQPMMGQQMQPPQSPQGNPFDMY